MRYLIAFLLLVLMQPIAAITKCEVNGRVIYKSGKCPKDARSAYLVNHQYVEADKLHKIRRDKVAQSAQAFEVMKAARNETSVSEEWVEPQPIEKKPAKLQLSNEAAHFQLRRVEPLSGSGYTSVAPEDVEQKLQEMQRRLQQHNEKLQKL